MLENVTKKKSFTNIAIMSLTMLYCVVALGAFISTGLEVPVYRVVIASKFVSNLIIFSCFVLSVRNKVLSKWLFVCFVGALVLAEFELFESSIFDLINNMGILKLHNPQYPRMVMALLCLVVCLFFLFKKISFIRLFSCTGIIVVILTSWIFHSVIVGGILEQAKKRSVNELLQIQNYSHELIRETCKHKQFFCYIKDRDIITDLYPTDKSQELLKSFSYVDGMNRPLFKNFIPKGNVLDDKVFNFYLIRFLKDGRDYQVIDFFTIEKTKELLVSYFYFLSLCAHFSWFLILSYCLYIHRKRILTFEKLYS